MIKAHQVIHAELQVDDYEIWSISSRLIIYSSVSQIVFHGNMGFHIICCRIQPLMFLLLLQTQNWFWPE